MPSGVSKMEQHHEGIMSYSIIGSDQQKYIEC